MIVVNANKTVAVNRETAWIKVGPATPTGVKLQLIDCKAGVATYGRYEAGGAWTHWQGLPYFEEDED